MQCRWIKKKLYKDPGGLQRKMQQYNTQRCCVENVLHDVLDVHYDHNNNKFDLTDF